MFNLQQIMMDKQQLQKLRDLPIEGVAERLGLRVTRHKSLCPFHADSHPSLSYRVSKNTFRCFVCGASGGTIDLVMRRLGKSFPEACRWLADEHNVILDQWTDRGATEGERGAGERPFDPSRYERFFLRPWLSDEARRFLFEERQLDPRVVSWCRLSSWKDRRGVPWLQIPYYDREGRLTGIQNRNLVRGASPRFSFPQGSRCDLYNLPVLNLLKPGDALYIAEGASDCWSLLSAGHKAVAIPSATLLTRRVAEELAELTKTITGTGSAKRLSKQRRTGTITGAITGTPPVTFHMWPDNDAPGERLFLQLQQVLPQLERHQLPPDCKDFSDYYLRHLKSLPGKC